MTAFRTWSDRLDSGRLTKSQISQFAQAISRRVMGEPPKGKHTALTDSECESLYDRIQASPVLLTEEHTTQGINWLASHSQKALDMDQETHDALMAGFHHFSWDGEITSGRRVTLPVWTVHLVDGRELRYYNAAWQSVPGLASYWWDSDDPYDLPWPMKRSKTGIASWPRSESEDRDNGIDHR